MILGPGGGNVQETAFFSFDFYPSVITVGVSNRICQRYNAIVHPCDNHYIELEPFDTVHRCRPQTGLCRIVAHLVLNPQVVDPFGLESTFILFQQILCPGHHAD